MRCNQTEGDKTEDWVYTGVAFYLERGFLRRVYNMGGPERLSRVDMAEKVAEAWGYSGDAIISAPASSVNRGVACPADISMVSSKLESEIGFNLTSFSDALALIHRPL